MKAYNRRMGVAFSSPDSAYTRLTAVYRCTCGAAASEAGRHAAELPPGWERLSEERVLCPHCVELRRAAEAKPG